MSAIAFLAWAAQMHALGKAFGSNRKAGHVTARIGDLAQSIQKSQRLKHRRVDADTDRRITGFNSPQGRAARKGSLGYDRCGQSPPTPGIPDILSEFAKTASYAQGRAVWSGHKESSCAIKANNVTPSFH
jgi:hypothetical protein